MLGVKPPSIRALHNSTRWAPPISPRQPRPPLNQCKSRVRSSRLPDSKSVGLPVEVRTTAREIRIYSNDSFKHQTWHSCSSCRAMAGRLMRPLASCRQIDPLVVLWSKRGVAFIDSSLAPTALPTRMCLCPSSTLSYMRVDEGPSATQCAP